MTTYSFISQDFRSNESAYHGSQILYYSVQLEEVDGIGPWRRIVLSYGMRTPSKIEAAGGPADTSKQQIEVNSITWKRDYKGCMVTIFGSRSAGWNVQIDKREPIILGYTRPRAIKYAKELIDEEQAKFHSRSAGGLPRNNKAFPGSARHSFPTVISADRRRG